MRSLEIIGEASKKLPENVKATQPDIEWRKVTGMRDKLIHDYFGVDYTNILLMPSKIRNRGKGNIRHGFHRWRGSGGTPVKCASL